MVNELKNEEVQIKVVVKVERGRTSSMGTLLLLLFVWFFFFSLMPFNSKFCKHKCDSSSNVSFPLTQHLLVCKDESARVQ